MTAALLPPPPTSTHAEPHGFPRTLHAEWTKFRTVRGWVLAMAGALLVTIVVGLLGTAAPAPGPRGTDSASYPTGPGGVAVNDSFFFVHRTLTGDGTLTVALRSLTGVADTGTGRTVPGAQPWAKAGIIVKESLAQGSPYAAVLATGGHGVRMQYDYTQDRAGPSGRVSEESPRWLRLVRSGERLTGYASLDGSRWREVGHVRLTGLARTVQAGLFATSPEAKHDTAAGAGFSPAVATGAFGRPALTGGWSPKAWHGTQVGGGAGTSGSYSDTTGGGFTRTDGGGFTVTGAGDIAPVVGGPVMGGGYSVENFLVGTFAGLIVMIAVGTVFITGEYRSGMLRTTMAATPLRGRVLGAKALVSGGVAFAVGLLAAAITVPVGTHSAHGRGFHVFPVPWVTEVRVMVGTGLLCAAVTVLALAAGTLLRRSGTAVTLVIASIVLPFLLAASGVLPPGVSDWLLRVTPAAGFAVQQTLPRYAQVLSVYEPSTGYYPLTPWAGLAVLCGYAALAFGLAVLRLRGRDV
ncbi:ABC transporter permease subunit [Streptomyces scabiei]|uniref:ABC transporter permease subunit n=1 Tax=Streptomyces scabiei TaxID=1930 RepID=UPI0029B9E089|nr:ABC transporter permease subunit [Streptomyces scabiei]MDX3520179.1 ABC transporter permease subunit [Streptomyces scabiei]